MVVYGLFGFCAVSVKAVDTRQAIHGNRQTVPKILIGWRSKARPPMPEFGIVSGALRGLHAT